MHGDLCHELCVKLPTCHLQTATLVARGTTGEYIFAGELGPDHDQGSDTHCNVVTGDTARDRLKDTSGPASNILMGSIQSSAFFVGQPFLTHNAEEGPFR